MRYTQRKPQGVHPYYYSIDKAADEGTAFDKRIAGYYHELVNDRRFATREKAYAEFFHVKRAPKKVITFSYNEDAIRTARRYLGYFSLMTGEKTDAFTALHLYKMKDIVEKGFGNLKERLNMQRLLVSSECRLDGKIFAEFVALILLSHLDRKMKNAQLYRSYTIDQLLDRIDMIECFESPQHSLYLGEILTKQADIFSHLTFCSHPRYELLRIWVTSRSGRGYFVELQSNLQIHADDDRLFSLGL